MTTDTVLPKQMLDGEVTLEQAKKDPKPGTKFYVEKTGSHGVILEERSNRGKLQARMTCVLGGPDHIREVSDWHQCGVSPEKKKKSGKAKKATEKADPNKVRAELEAELLKAQQEAGLAPAQPVAEQVAEAKPTEATEPAPSV